MSFDSTMKRAGSADAHADVLAEMAQSALAEGREEEAISLLVAAAQKRGLPLLWQWAALLLRSIDEHEEALKAFREAAALAPRDATVAHGHAVVALEAGVDAITLFQRARQLAPNNGQIIIGLNAARAAAGRRDEARQELEAMLDRAPMWMEGHMQFAQLSAFAGDAASATRTLERALERHPDQTLLWQELCSLQLRREDHEQLLASVSRAIAAGQLPEAFRPLAAIAAGELGHPTAEQLLSAGAAEHDPSLRVWRLRHLLRCGRAAEASWLIDQELVSDRAQFVWPYAAVVWRLTGDQRAEWLEGDPRLVAVMDLEQELGSIAELTELLSSLHANSGQYLDQSVRGGSQTDGPLLSRIDPPIRKLRAAIVAAVERYVAQLPPPDPRHPLLAPPRDRRIRFAGSWSVRLRGGGRHANHVHPQGWISSALYLSLPERSAGDPSNAGWLTLGEPQDALGLALPPQREIEPKVGRLVLFPSWMWHGTVPFAEGERLTVAFDVALPR